MLSLKALGLAILSAAAFSVCDTMAAAWARDGSMRFLFLTLALGPAGYLIFGIMNQRTELAVAGGLVNGLIILFTALAGTLLFRQELKVHQIAGLVLIIAGVLLASWNPGEPTRETTTQS